MTTYSTFARSLVRPFGRAVLMLGALALCACGVDAIVTVAADAASHSIAASAGQKIDVILGNAGPAAYAASPMVSSTVVKLLRVDVVPPNTPGGVTQRFRFRAASAGMAVVTFQRTMEGTIVSTVADTIRVR